MQINIPKVTVAQRGYLALQSAQCWFICLDFNNSNYLLRSYSDKYVIYNY